MSPSFYARFVRYAGAVASDREQLRERICTAFDGMEIPGDSVLWVQLPLVEQGFSVTAAKIRFLATEFARLKELSGADLLHTIN